MPAPPDDAEATARTWYILGAGAIGGLFAARLALAGQPLQVLTRDAAAAAALDAQGLTLEDAAGTHHVRVAAAAVTAPGPLIRRLLICTKAPQTLAALAPLRARLNADSRIVLLQNGMGGAERIHAAHPQPRLLLATTTLGAYRRGPWQVVHAGLGETALGDGPLPLPAAEREELLASLARSGLPLCWDDDIRTRLWRKLAINCAINPATALLDCANGALADDDDARTLVATVCAEAAAVMRAEGLRADAGELASAVHAAARATAANRSSMRADVAAGRETEIDYINGYLLQRAVAHGLSVPGNALLTALIRLKTARPGESA